MAKKILLKISETRALKLVFWGIAVAFLAAVLFCGHFRTVSLPGIGGGECGKISFLINTISSGNNPLLYGLILISLVVITAIVKTPKKKIKQFSRRFLAFQKFRESAGKLHNPILRQFRRGIIHTQIYGFSATTG